MANQIIIDIGAVANDGTGDPLRTAFGYVNNNFSNIWATGVANSNIAFSGNKILTTNTNGNLVLSPNGTGKVQANVDIVPNANNTLNLGSLTNKWNTVYTQYLEISGTLTTSDLTVDGNLTVTGNVIQIGNLVTDAKTIQLSNTASTANAANGSGITVGANDNIATMLYRSSDNVWVTNIGLNVNGNLLLANGASLKNTGTDLLRVNSPANGVARLQGTNADGNSTGASFSADGVLSQASITAYDVANSVGKTWFFNNAGELINPGNILVTAGHGIIGTGAGTFLIGFTTLNSEESYITRGTFSGNSTTGDGSLYVGSPSYTDLGTDVMGQFTGNVVNYAQLNLQNYGNSPTSSGDYIITANNGTDSTHFLNLGLTNSNWDGTQPNSLGNRLGPNDGYLYVQDGDFTIGTSNGNIETWKFGQDGTLTVAGDINPTANNTQSLGNATNQWSDLYVSNATIFMNGVPISLGDGNVLTVNGEAVLSNDSNTSISTTGNVSAEILTANIAVNIGTGAIGIGDDNYLVVETLVPGGLRPSNDDTYNLGNVSHRWSEVHANVYYGDGSQLTGLNLTSISNDGSIVDIVVPNGDVTITANSTQTWAFGTDGRLTFPGTPRIATDANNFEVQAAESINFEANAVVNIYTDTSGTTYQWQFGDNGNLNLPAGGSIIVDGGVGAVGPVGDNLVISWDNEELILQSVGGDVDVEADRDFNIRVNYDGGAGDYLTKWVFGQNNEIVNITGNSAIVTEAGNLNLQGGRNTLSSGNVQITAVDNGVAVNTWTFDNTGNLTAPGNVIFADNYVYSGNTFTSPETNGILKNFKWEFSDLSYGADTVTLQWNLLDTTFPQWYLTTNSQGNTYVFDGDAKTLGFLDNSINSGTVTFGTAANNGAGNSNDIELTTVTGNAYVRTGSNSWKFDNTGVLTVPGNIATSWLDIGNIGNIATLQADVSLQITANASGSAPYWTFNSDGNLFVPGSINGDNNGPLLIDGVGSGEGYISLPSASFGGEQVSIVNQFSLGNGISLVTNGGEWHFGNSGAFTSPGAITANGDVSGQVLISTQSAANEGGEIQLALPSSGTTLTGNIIIDSYQNSIRFFESGNSRGMFVDVPNVSASGQYAIGYRDVPQIALSANVTADGLSAGKHFYSTTAGNLQVTIPDNANVAYPTGATITIVVNAAGNVIVAQGTGVSLYMAGSSSTGNRTVGAYGLASVMKVATDTWIISGTGVY